jgi:heme/copper-type cytochrome/quinol oxidase subunit 2
MFFIDTLLSILIGTSAGLLYGVLFIAQKIRTPKNDATPAQLWSHRITTILISMLRITLLVIGWYCLLHLRTIPFILVLVSFLAGFWLLILKKKV